MIPRAVLFVLALAALPAAAEPPVAQVSPKLTGFEAGVFCAPDTVRRIPAPETDQGSIGVPAGETRVLFPSATVPAALGMAFGVRAQSAAGVIDGATFSVTHPPLKGSGGTRDAWQTTFSPLGPTANFWNFELPGELVTGPWRMRATRDGEVLFDVTFEVVPPEQLPEIVKACQNLDATLS